MADQGGPALPPGGGRRESRTGPLSRQASRAGEEYAAIFAEDPFDITPGRAELDEGFVLERRGVTSRQPIRKDDDSSTDI